MSDLEIVMGTYWRVSNYIRVRDPEITKDMFERRDLSLCLLENAG